MKLTQLIEIIERCCVIMNIPLLSMMLSQSQVQQAASVSVMKHGLGSVEQQRKAVHKLLDSAMDRGTG